MPRAPVASGSFSTAKWVVLVALSFVVLVGVAGWTYLAVSKSLRESRATGLTTLLNTQATAIQVWVEEKKRFAERWTANPLIGTYIERVVAEANSRTESTAFCQLPEALELSRALQPFFKSEESVAFHVITPGGRIAASVAGGACGRQIANEEFFASLAPVFKGQTRFIRPYADGKALPRWTEAGPSRPVIWIEAPIRTADGAIIASLGFGKYADDQFSKILGVSRPGQTGEAYAFDEQPVLLSESRFRPALTAIDKNAGMAMRQAVRDPGGDLLAGFGLAASAERPLTRLAHGAISSRTESSAERRTGVLLEPYRNYRGATVVGAWTWLPEYDFGLALEMDAEEAYRPLRHVLNAFAALFAVLLLFAILFGISSWSVLRLRLREARRVGQYTLEQQIGEGGISRVYLARHAHLKRPAAVKVLKMHLTTDEIVARFEREAQLCSQLTHPNTVEIFDYGRTRGGVSYYAMEYLRGATLAEIIEHTGPMPVGRVIHVLRHVCGSLGEAHEKGLIHRDVKPQNIMLCTQGGAYDVVKVVDFGLVKELRVTHGNSGRVDAGVPIDMSAPVDLTQHSRVLGTPLYMAPERLRNPADADARADIYALAAVAFYLLSGRPIFENVADQALIEKVLNEPVRDVGVSLGHRVPGALADLLAQCLEKDRTMRPDSVAEFASVLDVVGHDWSWTEFDARRWWEQHGETVARARPTFATKV